MYSIVDTNCYCGDAATRLRREGVTAVIRYYSQYASKRLRPEEAVRFMSAGLKIGVVYEDDNKPQGFDEQHGYDCGHRACEYAKFAIRQPVGSAIYFAVDFDANEHQVDNLVVPFFKGVARAVAESGGAYRVGVYGSGLVCRKILEAGLAEYVWLACSRAWQETHTFEQSGRWHLRQHAPEYKLCGIDVDGNDSNPSIPEFGAFRAEVAAANGGNRFLVNVRTLRIRSIPSIDGEIIGKLSEGTMVYVLSHEEDEKGRVWAQIDLQGDGVADGYVYASYLKAD